MKASVYVSPFNRTDLIDDNVTIVSISPLPKLKKNGELVMYRKYMSYDDVKFRALYKKGIRVASVIYSDGTQCDNVWINIEDIREE
jgi:hypothetical protein